MKKSGFLIFVVFMLVVSLSFAVLSASCTKQPEPSVSPDSTSSPDLTSKPVFVLNYALFQPAASLLAKTQTEYAREIENRTGGQVKINVHQAGSLLEAPGMYNGIRNGIADMGNSITSYTPGNFPFTEICQLPVPAKSGWSVSKAMYDFMQKYKLEEWNKVHLLTTVGPGFDVGCISLAKEPIEKLEDFKGKSIRGNDPDMIVAFGGTVKDLPMTDIYDGLSKGVLDGFQGNCMPLISWKFGDVCKHVTVNGAPIQTSMLWYDIMNNDTWNSLPPDIQKTITDVSEEYCGKFGLVWDDSTIEGIKYAQSVGSTVYLIPEDEEKRWTEAIEPVIDARLEKLATKFPKQEVDEAWDYFHSRVIYWNEQLSANNVTPIIDRVKELLKD